MNEFDHILNWKLLSGSHKFPGPNGGTCINEAAIVAAGFRYRKVGSVHDMPPCFSRMLSYYALALNDGLSDVERQGLMRFVGRLAGTNGVEAAEVKRVEAIALHILTHVVPIMFEENGIRASADALRRITEYKAALRFVSDVLVCCPLQIQGRDRDLLDPITRLLHVDDAGTSGRRFSFYYAGVRALAVMCCELGRRVHKAQAVFMSAHDPMPPFSFDAAHNAPVPEHRRRMNDMIVQHALDALDAGINVIPPPELDPALVVERLEKAKPLGIEYQPADA